jgi:N6-L-threonylcarbamoyladenine synthase
MRILGIETSCDETAAAVVKDGQRMLSNVVSSSVDLHKAYGGVVPEIAARSHLEVITPVIQEALESAKCTWDEIDAVAVTYGPGLGGSLLIGTMTAKTLAIAKKKPLYPINHVEAHIYANYITETPLRNYQLPLKPPTLPLLALIVSGGHSHLIYLKNHSDYEVIGRTYDDAVGEAFDKVAKILGLPYPGGPSIEKAAATGNNSAIVLPKAKMAGKYDFSFSGLKTAVLRAAQAAAGKDFTFPSYELADLLSTSQKADLAASFQHTALQTLLDNLSAAIADYSPTSVVIGGGVAANSALRQMVKEQISSEVTYTDIKLCTDNAAMIAALAYFKQKNTDATNPYSQEIDANLAM